MRVPSVRGPLSRVEVAVPRPLPTGFTYEVPPSLLRPGESGLPPGARVRVPFGARELTGVVLGPARDPADGDPAGSPSRSFVPKPVAARLDDPLPALPESLLDLARRLSEATFCPLGIVLRAMLPAAAAGRGGRRLRTARLTPEGAALLGTPAEPSDGSPEGSPDGTLPVLGRDDRRILTLLAVSGGPVPLVRIRSELDLSPHRGFARLEREGLVTLAAERVASFSSSSGRPPSPSAADDPETPPALTPAQQFAARQVGAAVAGRRFAAFLLHGVTGSGKTEVYFRGVADCLAAGRTALLLVPEIALAARAEELLRRRFGPDLAVFHSGLTRKERREAFWRVRAGEARIVLGARSAVLAPINDLGLVVLDEEHDSAYKQEEAPRYHARQAAWLRARAAGATLLLGSATPSLESAEAAASGLLTLLRLPSRIGGRRLPQVGVVDMRPHLRAHREDPARRGPLVLSLPLAEALREAVDAGRQALVLLNRRGYGGRLACLRCGEIVACDRCRLALTLHRRGHLAVCHGCGLGTPPPAACPACGGDVLRAEGFGTEKVEEEVSRLLPGARVERFDRDTTRVRGSHRRVLDAFRRGEIRVLVGTQMIAKGHDFPQVTLVGVVAADGGLGAPDFRAAERTFQLLTQVAGRAGRGEAPGRVLIQTMKPDHYAVTAAADQDYEAFRAAEREMRRRFGYPPFTRLTGLTISGPNSCEAESTARDLADSLAAGAAGVEVPGVEVLGPAPAPGPRSAGLSRWQLLVKAAPSARPAVRRRLRRLLDFPPLARRLTINDDP